jgi:hypothetical protein
VRNKLQSFGNSLKDWHIQLFLRELIEKVEGNVEMVAASAYTIHSLNTG